MSVPLGTMERANLLSKGNAALSDHALEWKGEVRSADYVTLPPIHAIKQTLRLAACQIPYRQASCRPEAAERPMSLVLEGPPRRRDVPKGPGGGTWSSLRLCLERRSARRIDAMQNGIEIKFARGSACAGRPPQQIFILHRENAAGRCDRAFVTKLLDDTSYKSTPNTEHWPACPEHADPARNMFSHCPIIHRPSCDHQG